MYLYFNKLGTLTTSIPHGEIPRQGSTLNLYVCLDSDFFETEEQRKKSVVNIDLILPNDEIGTRKWVTVEDARLLPFRKKTNNETIGDFVDGGYYWTYHFKFDAQGSTIYAGKLNAAVSIREIESGSFDESLDLEEIEELEVKYFGVADIIVEKTFGKASFNDNISQSHYSNISKQINALVSRVNNFIEDASLVVANPKLNGNEERLESISIDKINYKLDFATEEDLEQLSQTVKDEIEPKIEEIKENYALKEEILTDYNDLENKPIENEENDDALYVADKEGNIIARFDKTGFYTTSIHENEEDISNKYASKKDLADELAKLIDSSPEALNTLNELAAALGDNPNFATDVVNLIGTKLGKEETAVDSEKLGGIEAERYALKDEIIDDYNELKNRPIQNEENDDSLYIADKNGNLIVRIDNGGLHATKIYSNGKEVALKEMTFTGTMKEYESVNANGKIPNGAIVNIIDDEE